MKAEKHIVMFSGGKDSTAMLMRMAREDFKIDEIICADLGMEFPEMYQHIKKVEKLLNREITIISLEYPFEYYMFAYEKTKGKMETEGQPVFLWTDYKTGYSFPDMGSRWCTGLKKQIIKQYMRTEYKGYQIVEYHGIAANEDKRQKKNNDGRRIITPLVKWGMTEKDALNYCYESGFDWGGLYEKLRRVSCWCCPLKSLPELEVLYNEYPEYWNKLKFWEKNTWRTFRANSTIEDLENRFYDNQNQGILF
jgi:3'-phosphoadenosine 5'-phosphosulfate sulfotransferase (PAPS reductase)/FAD synthetase